jgi:hypothetical protein
MLDCPNKFYSKRKIGIAVHVGLYGKRLFIFIAADKLKKIHVNSSLKNIDDQFATASFFEAPFQSPIV